MVEEEFIVGEDNEEPHESQDVLLPAVVRSEMNFLRFPFFALHWRNLRRNNKMMVYEFADVRDGKRDKFKVSIIPSTEYGRPTAFDRRVARAIDVLIDEEYVRSGNRLKNPIPFSIYRIAKLMGRESSIGGRIYKDLKESI